MIAPIGSENYVAYSLVLALMVGCIRLSLGVLRLGVLVNLLSGPVIVGFTNAAAFIIATSQLHKILGVEAQHGDVHMLMVVHVVEAALLEVHWPTLGMGALAGGLLLFLRWVNSALPVMLMTVVITTLVSWLTGFSGAVVGEVPRGLPLPIVPEIDFEVLPPLFLGALTLTLIGLISKHGILIVDFANRLVLEGYDRKAAVLKAAALRLRPILMTTVATVLGVLPLVLAFGAGANSRFAIGLMIAAGMSVGTLFTLFVLPTFYLVLGKDPVAVSSEDSMAEQPVLNS
mgnify:CR=1 FL=1